MRASILRAVVASLLIAPVVAPAARVAAQQARPPAPPPAARILIAPGEQEIRTSIEALLYTPDVVLATDYYTIDMRSTPSIMMDAMVVTAVDSQTRRKGVRVRVRDDAKPTPSVGVSYLDYDEIASLSRALVSIVDLSSKWTGLDDQRAAELSFTTTGGLHIEIHEAGRTFRAAISAGSLTQSAGRPLEITEFQLVKTAVDQALAILDAK